MPNKLDQSEAILFSQILFEKGPDALDKWLDSLASRPTEECVLEQIASLHTSHNLFTFLIGVKDADVRPTLNLILEATRQLHHFDMSDVVNLFRFAHKLEPAFLFYVEQTLRHIFDCNAVLIEGLLEELKKEDLLSVSATLMWASMYNRFASVNLLEILRAGSGTTESDYLIRVALFVSLTEISQLESFEYSEVVAAIVPDVQRLISANPELYVAWSALCIASEFSEQAAMDLQSIPSLNNQIAYTALLQWIAKKGMPELTCVKIPISQLLLPISKIAVINDEARYSFDAFMSQLIGRKSLRVEVHKVLRLFLEANIDITKFNLLMHSLSRDHDFFTQVFSEWLTTMDSNLAAVVSMIRGCVAEKYPCRLDSEVLKKAGSSGQKRAAMRLLMWTNNAPCLMKFAEDFAEDPQKQPDGLVWADEIIRHLIMEYPMSSADWLELKAARAPTTEFDELYRHHREQAVSFRDALVQLPESLELAPTNEQRLAMRQRDVRNQRQIGKAAREKSIFSQISARVNVLQGKRFATVMPDGSVNISDMAEISFSIELPVSERADPVGAIITRLDYLGKAK